MSNALLTDLYQLTMGQSYFDAGKHRVISDFDVYFRKIPDNGGYAVASGLRNIVKYIQSFKFEKSDIDYLKSLGKFSEDYLKYLQNLKITCDINSVPDGTVVFANEPVITVRGSLLEAQLIETALLLYFNHSTLIATKSARINYAAGGRAVIEFGARRAHGEDAAVEGAADAFIGGCVGTSCVMAGKLYGIPVSGTMAHSYVQSFSNEYEAFKNYAQSFPADCVLLADTVDTLKSGVPNAVAINNNIMKPQNKSVKAIRLDSGDLAYLSKESRKMLDAAGMQETQIIVSNALDEYLIESLLQQNAPINAFGVGENLITSKNSPVMGGIYKLAAVEENSEVVPKIKVSDNIEKTTVPGRKKVYRFIDKKTGCMQADLVALHSETISKISYKLTDHTASWNTKRLSGYNLEELLIPVFKKGELVYKLPSLQETRKYADSQKAQLWDELKRLKNPHKYTVDLTVNLHKLKVAMLQNKQIK